MNSGDVELEESEIVMDDRSRPAAYSNLTLHSEDEFESAGPAAGEKRRQDGEDARGDKGSGAKKAKKAKYILPLIISPTRRSIEGDARDGELPSAGEKEKKLKRPPKAKYVIFRTTPFPTA